MWILGCYASYTAVALGRSCLLSSPFRSMQDLCIWTRNLGWLLKKDVSHQQLYFKLPPRGLALLGCIPLRMWLHMATFGQKS